MRILYIILAASLVASPVAFASTAVVASTPSEQAIQLDRQSRATLGIGIRALSLLLDAQGPSLHFFRKDMLIEDGSWSSVQELDKNGYATVKIVTGVPDGSDPRTEHVVIELTAKGAAVAKSLVPGP